MLRRSGSVNSVDSLTCVNTIVPYDSDTPAVKSNAKIVDKFDAVALDAEMAAVLQNTALNSNEKWIQYYNTLQRHLYKKDPQFKPIQFKFEVQEEQNGEWSYVLKGNQTVKYLKYIPAVVGPIVGALVAAFLK